MTKLPLYIRLLYNFMPKQLSHDPGFIEKRIVPIIAKPFQEIGEGTMEYLANISKTDEHYIRIHEGALCWGLENVGVSLCYDEAAYLSGMFKFFDKEGRDWNAVETVCMGQGSPYCELKLVPGQLDELEGYLMDMDGVNAERITERSMEYVIDFVLHGKPLGQRPRLGSEMHFYNLIPITALYSQRYQMAVRMAGAITGKRLGEHLIITGMGKNEVIKRVLDFMEYCKVGKITLGETIRIRENYESFGLETGDLNCFFTTGFLNGLFSAVKNHHVREIKCIAAGDPYCEWEIV